MCAGSRPLGRGEFEVTLDKVEELLAQSGGPFFMGPTISGVDCAFAPFLERWSHQVNVPSLSATLAILLLLLLLLPLAHVQAQTCKMCK